MKLMVLVLDKMELLDKILDHLERRGIRGATVLNSRGMNMELENYMDGSFLGSLRATLETERQENRTVLIVLPDEKVQVARDVIESLVDLQKPHTGVLFTVPVDFTKGIQA